MLGAAKVISGMPRTERNAREVAKRWAWLQRSVECSGGKGGMRTEYQPPADVLELIHSFLEANPEFFNKKAGKGFTYAPKLSLSAAPAMHHAVHEDVTVYQKSFVSVPLYDARAATGAGGGAVIDQEHIADVLQFSEVWIKRELRATPSDLYLIYVDGESMEPTLRSGDVILLDRRATKPDREGIYILRMDGMLLVKRLQGLPGSMIKVASDNPAYESFTVRLAEMQDQDFAILGRVVWSGRRM